MGVYIKGMEMPKSCERCQMLDWDLDYIKCKVTDRHFKVTECWRAIRVPDCPLVPVPPHGRLIDGDALDAYLKTAAIMADGEAKEAYIDARAEARTMPVIIPAEEGE